MEVLWKAWKASAHVPAFATAHAARVEGLLGTAIAAAALQRLLAPMPQRRAEGPMSTRTVAMWVLSQILLRRP